MAKTKAQSSVQDLTKKREEAISAMSDALREVFSSIETQLDDLKNQNIQQYYRIGVLLNRVSTRPDEYPTLNGKDGVTTLAKALNMEKRALRFAQQFNSTYNDSQLAGLLTLRNPHTNYRLNFGHVKYLMSVLDVPKRESYAEQAVADSLSPSELHELIKRRENREPAHGRTHTLPASLTAQLAQILKVSQNFVAKQETVWNGQTVSVFANIRNAEATELTAEHVEMLQDIAQLMRQMQVYAAANVPLCETLAEEVQRRVNSEEARVAVAQADAAASGTATRARRQRVLRTSELLAEAG